ncbi:FAD-linked oxidoreductase-like protein 18 [Paraphaeosphaeria sporulosa]
MEELELNVLGQLIAGSIIASLKPIDAALNPVWHNAGVHLVVKASWDQSIPTTKIQQIRDRMTGQIGYTIHRLSPDSERYVNEVGCHFLHCSRAKLTWSSVINMKPIGNGHYVSQLTPVCDLSRPNMIWLRFCGVESAWEVTSGGLYRQGLTMRWPSYGLSNLV